MLRDDAIERYARQIVVPGIGAAGQERLLASTVLVAGNPRGCRQAALYLRAAGVTVHDWGGAGGSEKADLVLVADAGRLSGADLEALVVPGRPLCWYRSDEEGFTSGVHPGARLPTGRDANAGTMASKAESPVHDAAACETASLACAVLAGLPLRSEQARFEVAP